MKIFCVIMAVAAVLAIAFFILKYHILMNLALNARSRNLLSVKVSEEIPARELEIRRQIQEDGEWMEALPGRTLRFCLRIDCGWWGITSIPRGKHGGWTGDFGSIGRCLGITER